jgi:hypothetical protein
MSEPENLKQRVDPGNFQKFLYRGLDIYIQKDMLSDGEIDFTIPDEGGFTITVTISDTT